MKKILAQIVLKPNEMSDFKYNEDMKVRDFVRIHLTELREERGWTQREVAERLNISQRTYSHYENGSRNMSIDMLADIANLYGVSVAFLVDDKSEVGGVVQGTDITDTDYNI